jgi:hypothetical protein
MHRGAGVQRFGGSTLRVEVSSVPVGLEAAFESVHELMPPAPGGSVHANEVETDWFWV